MFSELVFTQSQEELQPRVYMIPELKLNSKWARKVFSTFKKGLESEPFNLAAHLADNPAARAADFALFSAFPWATGALTSRRVC